MPASESWCYSSKIIKAGALLADTKTLLTYWDDMTSVTENLDRFRRENLFGKTSRSRVEDILAIFKQRYLRDPELLPALVVLAKGRLPAESFDPILYYLALRSDRLLHDAVCDVLVPAHLKGQQEIPINVITGWLRQQIDAGQTERPWGSETTTRVAQGIMATLRDFGMLQGAVIKRIAPVHLPTPAFAFLAFLRSRELRSGDRLLHDPEWQVFFLPQPIVERFFVEAHQEHLLEYHAAGRVIRITFPADTPKDYAHALTQRVY